MPSPKFPFRFMTAAEFADVRAYAVSVATGGQFASISGGGKSGSFATMDTAELLFEVSAEVQRRGGTIGAQKVSQVITGEPAT